MSSYRKPDNPVLDEFGGVSLAVNDEEYLLLELLPSVAVNFLKNRRREEYEAQHESEIKEAQAASDAEAEEEMIPVTGPTISAPMGGKVIAVNVKPGQKVKKGDVVLVYEAMKMENDVEAPADGVVKRLFVELGDVVGTDALLVEFDD